ncbi:MAG: L-histidine N(alpha)-methyltransferase [Acaryochloridaceae cyanobacterium SU_2_1]|nr:L-histidine N(alpha)-methyltransferase [Acaryochloridaceae cyanobacterium SU_2_1]
MFSFKSSYPTPLVSPATSDGQLNPRLKITELLASPPPQTLVEPLSTDLLRGLTQTPKTLPARYFYDDLGSQLFEQICDLPEYYLTRTETEILRRCAPEIAHRTGACELVELGSGSSTKTRLLLDAYTTAGWSIQYCPIDVSGGILQESAEALLQVYSDLHIHGFVGTYELALASLPQTHTQPRMICFLGSTLGNLNSHECQVFFAQLRQALQPGEFLLLGVDLQKPIPQLEAAYNDSQGITAAFNLNSLRHLNWRFQANFNLAQFEHWAFYNSQAHQIEMHLKSLCTQTVDLLALDQSIEFTAGETIRTEISRKFDLEVLQEQLCQPEEENSSQTLAKHLAPIQVWTDPQNWFGLLLCQCQKG